MLLIIVIQVLHLPFEVGHVISDLGELTLSLVYVILRLLIFMYDVLEKLGAKRRVERLQLPIRYPSALLYLVAELAYFFFVDLVNERLAHFILNS